MRRLACCAALALLAACQGDNLSCICAPVSVSTTSAWAGNDVILSSIAFVGADSAPLVLSDAETLAVRSVGPESIAVSAPLRDGYHSLDVVLLSGEVLTTEAVRSFGFVSLGSGPLITGYSQPWPGNGHPSLLAYVSGRVVVADLRTGIVTPLGSPADTGYTPCFPGPATSAPDPSILTLGRRTSCRPLAVRPTDPFTVLDSAPTYTDVFPALYMGPGRWIIHQKTWVTVVAGSTTYTDYCQASGYSFQPGPPPARFVVPIMCNNPAGNPVYDSKTGLHAYTMPFAQSILGAAFTDAGDTLFVFGGAITPFDHHTLWAVDAATGTRLDSVTIPDQTRVGDVALDPNGRWIYVAAGMYGGPPQPSEAKVWVFDRRTLALVAELRAPELSDNSRLIYRRLVVGSDRILYLVMNTYYQTAPGATVYRWSLMP